MTGSGAVVLASKKMAEKVNMSDKNKVHITGITTGKIEMCIRDRSALIYSEKLGTTTSAFSGLIALTSP